MALYISQKNLVEDLYKKGIKQKFISFDGMDIQKGDKKNEYKVYVISNIEVTDPNKGVETHKTKLVYTVFDDGEDRTIINIEDWK